MSQSCKLIMRCVRIACLAFFAVVFFVSAASAVMVIDQDLVFDTGTSGQVGVTPDRKSVV